MQSISKTATHQLKLTSTDKSSSSAANINSTISKTRRSLSLNTDQDRSNMPSSSREDNYLDEINSE